MLNLDTLPDLVAEVAQLKVTSNNSKRTSSRLELLGYNMSFQKLLVPEATKLDFFLSNLTMTITESLS